MERWQEYERGGVRRKRLIDTMQLKEKPQRPVDSAMGEETTPEDEVNLMTAETCPSRDLAQESAIGIFQPKCRQLAFSSQIDKSNSNFEKRRETHHDMQATARSGRREANHTPTPPWTRPGVAGRHVPLSNHPQHELAPNRGYGRHHPAEPAQSHAEW